MEDKKIITVDENTLAEKNERAEKEAQKRLKVALFKMFYENKTQFLRHLSFDKKEKVEAFETSYVHENSDGTTTEIKTSIKFTVFNLWTDENDPKKLQRKAINEQVKALADMASETPDKGARQNALNSLKEVCRLLGFCEIAESFNATDAKKILVDAYRMTDKGSDGSRVSEVKRAIQATLYRVSNTQSTDAE